MVIHLGVFLLGVLSYVLNFIFAPPFHNELYHICQIKVKRKSTNQVYGYGSFARSATSLGVSPYHCGAHHLHEVQHRSFVPFAVE